MKHTQRLRRYAIALAGDGACSVWWCFISPWGHRLGVGQCETAACSRAQTGGSRWQNHSPAHPRPDESKLWPASAVPRHRTSGSYTTRRALRA
jgi:hypothetical protein